MRLTFCSRPVSHSGFTLFELLVVISIIALLAAMLMPAIKLVRTAAYRASCQSNLRQMHLGLASYAEDFSVLPPYHNYNQNGFTQVTAATYLQSGRSDGSDGNNRYDVLKCPADKRPLAPDPLSSYWIDYVACMWAGTDGELSIFTRVWSSYTLNNRVFDGARSNAKSDIALMWDGFSPICQSVTYGSDLRIYPNGRNNHGQGINILFGDGHVESETFAPTKAGECWEIWDFAVDAYMNPKVHGIGVGYPVRYNDVTNPPWHD